MKYIFLLFLIAFSCFTSVLTLKSRHGKSRISHRRIRIRSRGPSDNIVYQFTLGVITSLGGDHAAIDTCTQQMPGWESAGVTEEKNLDDKKESVDGQLTEQVPTWKKVLGYMNTVLNVVCLIKDKIIEFFSGKKAKRRFFYQGRLRKGWLSKFFTDAWDTVKDAVVAGATKIKNAVVDGVDWAKKKGSELAEYIKTKTNEVLQPIYDLLESIDAKIKAYLEGTFLGKVYEILKCFIKNGAVQSIISIVSAVTSFVALIPLLATPIGWVKLAVNLICGWETIKNGIQYLQDGIKETDRKKKYNFYGKFLGSIIKSMT